MLGDHRSDDSSYIADHSRLLHQRGLLHMTVHKVPEYGVLFARVPPGSSPFPVESVSLTCLFLPLLDGVLLTEHIGTS